ncbi:MAG: 30S ribosomal protein S20 [Candidatus Tyrphobacter sp.]
MPNIKSAVKWVRQSSKRTTRNKDAKTRLRTLFKGAQSAALPASVVESAFDKAAAKGVIHKNKAARKKSRLAKSLRAASAAPAAKSAGGRKVSTRKTSKKKA